MLINRIQKLWHFYNLLKYFFKVLVDLWLTTHINNVIFSNVNKSKLANWRYFLAKKKFWFTPDAYKLCYSREVRRLNILSLLASFAREIHFTTDANMRHGRGFCRQLQSRCKMYSCFCKSTKMYIQLRVPTYNHDYFVLLCCFGFSASARNDVTARASSWLVNAAWISAKVQIFKFALKKCSIRAIRTASFARIALQDCLSRLCIDLTCKSFARFASFVSGVNAP